MLEDSTTLPGYESVLVRGFISSLAGVLSPQQAALLGLLKDGEPVPVDHLFAEINQTPGIFDQRMKQQRVGSVVSRLRGHLEPWGLCIVPGEPRGTYRLREAH